MSKYTHTDSSGMGWRFAGSRPISALADQIMQQCGLSYEEEKPKNKHEKTKTKIRRNRKRSAGNK